MDIQSASTLILDFQPLELEVIIDHQVYGILLLQPEQTKTPAICWIWITDSMVQLHTYCANCWCYPLKCNAQVPMSSQMSWLQLLCHSRSHLRCFSCSKYTTFEIFVIIMGGGWVARTGTLVNSENEWGRDWWSNIGRHCVSYLLLCFPKGQKGLKC